MVFIVRTRVQNFYYFLTVILGEGPDTHSFLLVVQSIKTAFS